MRNNRDAAKDSVPRIAITPGEPAGIGPDILIHLAQTEQRAELIAFADPELLNDRAHRLNLPLSLKEYSDKPSGERPQKSELSVYPIDLPTLPQPGKASAENASYVLETIKSATKLCIEQQLQALVTGPINKHIINAGGAYPSGAFSGHTEYLAELANTSRVVMMLSNENSEAKPLRVALATTHLPLSAVPGALSKLLIHDTVTILHNELQQKFGISQPRILVCGLNPHAGEQGDLGREEIEIINPSLNRLREQGIDVSDALPADTLFTQHHLTTADAVLAMYHDQGLPVLKSHSFGRAVNITLGLPFIRTSVDHGTAFDLAGSGKADAGSLTAAVACARKIALSAQCEK